MNTPVPIRVMLVDDHTMVRRGLATFLEVFDDLELAGQAGNGDEAIELCARLLPDVVLMDMVMPGMDGDTVTRLIRQQFPTVQIIALSSFKEEQMVQIADLIDSAIKNVEDEALLRSVKRDVKYLCEKFPLYSELN